MCKQTLCVTNRGTDGEKAVLQAIDAALSRASQAEPAFSPEKKKKGNLLDESYELQRSAFMAARAALKGAPSQQQLLCQCLYHCCIIVLGEGLYHLGLSRGRGR